VVDESHSPSRTEQVRRLFKYWPPAQSFVFLIVAAAALLLLKRGVSGAYLSHPEDLHATTVGSGQWRTWIGVAALGQATAIALVILGCVRLKRCQSTLRIKSTITVVAHTMLAAVFVFGVAGFAFLIAHDPRVWPVPHMGLRLGFVASVGIVCAFPWVALTWLVHQVTRPYWAKVDADPAPSLPTPPDGPEEKLELLTNVWENITVVALAFAVLVGIAIIPSGALRNLWLSQQGGSATTDKLEAAFPAGDVLAYGAFFGLLVAVLVIPLVASWRAAARSVVDAICPLNADTAGSKEAMEKRAHLEAMLHLDVGLFRNPLTLLSIFTPLLTATVAAFLPNLTS
jgi:hypothetical protein